MESLQKSEGSRTTSRLLLCLVYADLAGPAWAIGLVTGEFVRNGWRPFEDARAYVQNVGFNSSRLSGGPTADRGRKPDDIPSSAKILCRAGWNGWNDWLGSGGVRRTGWRPFEEARAFVQNLGLKSVVKDWRGYCRSGKKPTDIPSNPSTVYADAGWNGWGDWLGTWPPPWQRLAAL